MALVSKGVWLSSELIKDKSLSWTKKIILQEIAQLETLEHGCIANNRHFAELLGISKQAASKAISELERDGYIGIDNSETIRNYGRKISTVGGNEVSTYVDPPYQPTLTPPINLRLQSKDNKTNKTKTNNNRPPRQKPFGFIYTEEFEQLWKINRLGDKWNAYRAYHRIKDHYQHETLASVLKAEAKKEFGRRHTSTVFNGEIETQKKRRVR